LACIELHMYTQSNHQHQSLRYDIG
jgi:hypothetical protein